MENYIKNICDITYESELTPHPAYGWEARGANFKVVNPIIQRLGVGLNSPKRLMSFHSISRGLI